MVPYLKWDRESNTIFKKQQEVEIALFQMKPEAFPKATYRGHRLTCGQLERLICVRWGWGVAEGTLERVGAPLPEGRRGRFLASKYVTSLRLCWKPDGSD